MEFRRVLFRSPGLIAPRIKRQVHAVVSEALLAEQQLEIAYRAIGGTQSRSHRIHPLGLVLEGNVLYLVASFYDYDEQRQLAMPRIEKADRKSVVWGKSVSVRVDLGGSRSIKTKTTPHIRQTPK